MADNRRKRLPTRKEAQQRPMNPEREQQLWEALQESEDGFRLIFDDSPAHYVTVDTDGIVQNVNKAMLSTLGYSKDDVVGRHVLDFVVPEDVEKTATELAKALGNEKASEVEVGIYAKDGSVRTLLFPPNMAPLRNARGQTVAIIVAGIDITERKRVEEALRQSEERYRTLFQQSHDPVYIVSRDGALLDVNQAMCQLFDYSREDMLGMDIRRLYVNPAERADFQQAIEKEGAVKDYEIRFRRKDSKELECLVTSTVRLNSDGSIAGYQGTMRDITERKRIETALRTSEEKFRSLVQGANIGIATSDTEGVFTFANPALYRIYGYTEEEVLGKPILNFVHPDDRERVLDFFQAFRGNYNDVLHTEFRTLRKDGDIIYLHVSPTHIRNEGQTTGFIASMIDITERKLMEETLKQSEERYRTILDKTEDAYYEVDLAGNFTFMNKAGGLLLGYSSEEIIGADFRFVFPEQYQKNIFQAFNQVYRTGQPIRSLPFEAILRDGRHRHGELSVFPLRNEKGEIIGFRGIGHDITERKQMEEATREAEERYRALFDRSIEAVYIHDFEGNFVDANQVALDLLGYTGEDIPSLNFASLLDEEQILLAMQTLEELRETGRQQAINEFKLRRKDGKYVYVETEASVIHREEKPMVIQGIARDITERKRAEEMLQQSEQKLRNIFESATDGVFTVDMNGTYTEVNQAMLDMHRLTSKNDLIGINAFDCVAPSNTEEARAGMEQTTREGAIVTQQFISRRLGDGSEFPVEISAKLLTDAWGNATGFVGVARDVSQRKQAEEEKQQLEQKAQLASRLASVGELAAGIAHEINNPLTSVIGYAQLLSAEENIPADMKKDLKAIIDGANRVAGIVKRLLTFARQTKPQQTLVSIPDLITGTVDLRAYHLRNNNIKVTTQFDPEMPVITADPGQLQQVFLNLIVNAETEMKRAHGKGKLLITAEKVGKTIRISFKDDGPGIAKENLDRIFHPFFTTKEVGEGTGLGLSICYGIVSEHDGRIWAESQPGKGATFIVELPIVARAGQVKPAEPKEKRTQKAAKAKMLAVDDEPMILQLLTRLLTEEGYQVETAESATSALKMIDKERYNLILLDIKMPDMDGIQLYKRLQKITPSLAKRVMFITGDVMGPETEAFLSRAKAPYVTKPFDASKLKKEVRQLLSRGQ